MGRLLAALMVVALAPQDRVEIAGPIDTWYRVLQGKRSVGYMHELLKRELKTPWRFEYALEGEFELTLRVLDPRGEATSGVEVVLEVKDAVRREILGKEVSVIPVTFLKPFPAAARETELQEAYVDRYGRILEATMAGGGRIVMARSEAEAVADIGPLHRHGRGDPMDKMTAMRYASLERAKGSRGDDEVTKIVVTLDSLASDLAAARKLVDDIRNHRASGELDEARQTFVKALVHLKAIRHLAARRWPEMVPQLDQ